MQNQRTVEVHLEAVSTRFLQVISTVQRNDGHCPNLELKIVSVRYWICMVREMKFMRTRQNFRGLRELHLAVRIVKR